MSGGERLKKPRICEDTGSGEPVENVDGLWRPVWFVTGRHLKKSARLLEMSGGERLQKNRLFVKGLQALRPAENVDGS